MKSILSIRFLLCFSIPIQTILCNWTIPIGLVFSEKNYEIYKDLNDRARQLSMNLTLSSFTLNFVESIEKFTGNEMDVQSWSNLCDQISMGLVSIIGDATSEESNWFVDFGSFHQIPWINLSPSDNLIDRYSISMMPDLLPALISFIRHYDISQLVYIYDDELGAQRLKELIRLQTSIGGLNLNLISRFLSNAEDSHDLLENIELTTNSFQRHYISNLSIRHERYIVLDFHSIETYQILMNSIKQRGMTTTEFHYVLLTLDAKHLDMTYFRYGGVNVTFFSLPNVHPGHFRQVDFDLNSAQIEFLLLTDAWQTLIRSLMQVIDRSKINNTRSLFQFDHPSPMTNYSICRKSLARSTLDGHKLFQTLLKTNFRGSTGQIQFSNITGRRINYTFDIFRVTRNEIPKKLGYFREPNIFQIADDSSSSLRKTFDNRTRLIVTIIDEPFMMLKKTMNDSFNEKTIPRGTILDPSQVEGFCADLAYAICREKLKIPYKFLIETAYGTEIEKGVWNGMVGALVRRQADLSIASLTINGAREKAVDFSKPFIDLGISIMIRKPEKQKPGLFSFMDPLSKEIWICVILSYLMVSFILFVVSRTSSYEWYFEDMKNPRPKNKFTLHNSLFFMFAAFMHQGVDLLPRSVSGRVVTSAWWFFSLILVSSYTANLAAFLTVEKLVTPIETVEDLAKQTNIRYGAVKGGATMGFFNRSTLTTFKRMWNFMQHHRDEVFVLSNREGIEKVRRSKGKFAFLLESTLNEYVNERSPCDTMRIGENIDAKGYGIATPLGSDLREAINIAVLELTETGFLERLKQKWYYERSECTNAGTKDSKQSTPLNLANVAGMFYLLIFGLGTSMIIAFLEFLFKAKMDSMRSKQNIRDVMRRNLRISITGIDFDEKLNHMNYWPLQQQPKPLAFQNRLTPNVTERTPTIELPTETGNITDIDKKVSLTQRFNNMSHV